MLPCTQTQDDIDQIFVSVFRKVLIANIDVDGVSQAFPHFRGSHFLRTVGLGEGQNGAINAKLSQEVMKLEAKDHTL
jgi:hypothetical protein